MIEKKHECLTRQDAHLEIAAEALLTIHSILRLRMLNGTKYVSPAKVKQLFKIADDALAAMQGEGKRDE